jgi:hypothetical protein
LSAEVKADLAIKCCFKYILFSTSNSKISVGIDFQDAGDLHDFAKVAFGLNLAQPEPEVDVANVFVGDRRELYVSDGLLAELALVDKWFFEC